MATLAEELDELQRSNVQLACLIAQKQISSAQDALRKARPNNLFLNLARVTEDGIQFSKNFKSMIEEHTSFPKEVSWYYAIGEYIELLRKEVENPKYP
jgi:hypothetical protein